MEIVGTEYKMGEVMEIISMEVEAAMAGATTLVPVLAGDPGIGKSASMKFLAKKMNMDIAIFSVGASTMEEWSGLPEFGTMKIDARLHIAGKEDARTTEWTMSGIVATINAATTNAVNSGKNGVLVLLDDLHLVEPIVQKYLFEFLQNKTLQNFKLDPAAYLVGAMNGKDSAGMEGFLSAVLNRLAIYHVKFDMEFWYKNVGYNLHPYIASFAQQAGHQKYFTGANATDGASPSPRTWTDLSSFLPYIEEQTRGDLPRLNRICQIAADARVGSNAATDFMTHVTLFQKFDFDGILKKRDPKVKVGSDLNDQILMAFIIRYIKTEKDAEYLVELLKGNMDRRTFISIFMQEFSVLFTSIDKMEEGQQKKAIAKVCDLIATDDQDAFSNEMLDIVSAAMLDILD